MIVSVAPRRWLVRRLTKSHGVGQPRYDCGCRCGPISPQQPVTERKLGWVAGLISRVSVARGGEAEPLLDRVIHDELHPDDADDMHEPRLIDRYIEIEMEISEMDIEIHRERDRAPAGRRRVRPRRAS